MLCVWKGRENKAEKELKGIMFSGEGNDIDLGARGGIEGEVGTVETG